MIKRFDPIEGRNADIIEAVMQSPELADVSEDIKFKIRLCVEEVEENILGYSGSTWIEVSIERVADQIVIAFKDGGMEFDPLKKEDPDINAPLEERGIGGLGIFLCKQMMDEVTYRFVKGCNVFVMRKDINE